MPIFIAKTADFSANNLGQISLGYSQLTKDVIASTSKVMTENEKSALDTFLNTVNSEGILAKTKNLYIPIIAGNLSESFINIADANLSIDVTPNATYHQLNASGIKNFNPTNVADCRLNVNFDGTLGNDNLHYLTFNPTEYTAINEFPILFLNSEMYTNLSFRTGAGIEPGTSFKIGSNYDINSNWSSSFGTAMSGVNLKGFNFSSLNEIKTYYGGTENVLNYNSPIATQTTIEGDVSFTGYQSSSMLNEQAMISIGQSLTPAEHITYANASNALMTAFGII